MAIKIMFVAIILLIGMCMLAICKAAADEDQVAQDIYKKWDSAE